MSLPYDVTTDIGKIRLTIGDTDAANYVFTDDELTYFLTVNSGNINLAAADALEAWAAKYGQSPSTEGIGDYNYSQTVIFRLMQLSKRLRDTEAAKVKAAANAPYLTWAEMDLTSVPDGVEMGE